MISISYHLLRLLFSVLSFLVAKVTWNITEKNRIKAPDQFGHGQFKQFPSQHNNALNIDINLIDCPGFFAEKQA